MRLLLAGCLALVVPVFTPSPADVRGVASVGGKTTIDAAVWLDAPGHPRRQNQPKVVLDQRNLNFYPHVLVVQAGQTVEFPNHDRVFHNVFSFRDGQKFNLGLYPVGAVTEQSFDKAGLSRIFCNIHPGMAAYVLAVDSPYFAVSDKDGRFVLPEIPPGTYTYHAWRPGTEAPIVGSVTVGSSAVMDVKWK